MACSFSVAAIPKQYKERGTGGAGGWGIKGKVEAKQAPCNSASTAATRAESITTWRAELN